MSCRCCRLAAGLPGLVLLLACAAPSQTAPPSAGATAPPRLSELREEFDPEPYRDDGLLIQPEFGPPVSARSLEPSPVSAAPEPGAVVDAAAADTSTGDLLTPAADDSTTVYRVQVMALSADEAAQALAAELRQRLTAPVSVQPKGEFFMVRVGESTSQTVAEALRVRILALGPQYADAYVLPDRVPSTVPWEEGGDAPTDLSPAPEPAGQEPAPEPVDLVRTSGWRVLLDQFQDYQEATAFRQNALRRLQRNNIDAAVDIVFAAPWYKVEVGSFRTSGEAQNLAERVTGLGYRSALKVRDEVYLPKEGR